MIKLKCLVFFFVLNFCAVRSKDNNIKPSVISISPISRRYFYTAYTLYVGTTCMHNTTDNRVRIASIEHFLKTIFNRFKILYLFMYSSIPSRVPVHIHCHHDVVTTLRPILYIIYIRDIGRRRQLNTVNDEDGRIMIN